MQTATTNERALLAAQLVALSGIPVIDDIDSAVLEAARGGQLLPFDMRRLDRLAVRARDVLDARMRTKTQ